MPKSNLLTKEEKSTIISMLADRRSTLAISKTINRDHRTIKSFVKNPLKIRTRKDKGKRKKVTKKDMLCLKRSLARNPVSTSKSVFNDAGVSCTSRATRCRILKEIGFLATKKKAPPLSKANEIKRLAWAKEYMKIDFSNVVFTDECRVTLDEPDGFERG